MRGMEKYQELVDDLFASKRYPPVDHTTMLDRRIHCFEGTQ
jgi:hypothetical protein